MRADSPPFVAGEVRGGPPIIDSSTCIGSGTFAGTPPVGRLRGPPLGMRADRGRLAVEALGDTRGVNEDDRGFSPGLTGCAGAG